MSGRVVVLGATGHVGHGLAEGLRARGTEVTVVGRSEERLAKLTAKGAQAAVGTVSDREFLKRTFAGAAAVFALLPPDLADEKLVKHHHEQIDAIVDAVKAAGVPRVVALSSVGGELAKG